MQNQPLQRQKTMTSKSLNELPSLSLVNKQTNEENLKDRETLSEKPSHGFEPVNLTLGHNFIR